MTVTIFYCLRFDSRFESPSSRRARSPYLYPTGTGWPSYTPQALDSLPVDSYDSQGYGGGIRDSHLVPSTTLGTYRIENAVSNSSSVSYLSVSAGTYLSSSCLATAALLWLRYSGSQASHCSIYRWKFPVADLPCVEVGSNTFTIALRVVGGDEKGTQCLGV
jgi:hypothetical protein